MASYGSYKISKLRNLSYFRIIIVRGKYYMFQVDPLFLFAVLGVLLFRHSPNTIMYCHKKTRMTPCSFNIMFNEMIIIFCISEQNSRDLLVNMCNFQDLKQIEPRFILSSSKCCLCSYFYRPMGGFSTTNVPV